MKITKILLSVFTMGLLTSCGSHEIQDYSNTSPQLDLFSFFSGDLVASGVVRNRSGKVIRHFNADIKASIENNVLILDEYFVFSDGEEQYRKWEISREEGANFTGIANDIVGTAVGSSSGQALRWQYKMKLKSKGREFLISFDDWIFQVNDKTLINITDLTKWGFKVGEVVLVIEKLKAV